MPRPIDKTIHRIRTHTLDPVAAPIGDPAASILAIEDLLARLEQLVTIDDAAPSAIDGYPTKSPGARPPQPSPLRFDDDGNVIPPHADEKLELTPDPDGWYVLGHLPGNVTQPVEHAALALLEHGDPRDIVHRIRVQAEQAAEDAARALTILAGALARYDKSRLPLPIDTPQCFVAAVIHQLPLDEKWIPGTTGKHTRFDGVITLPWRTNRLVCRWTYDFTRRWRRLPTKDEMLEYLDTGYVRINESHEIRTARSA